MSLNFGNENIYFIPDDSVFQIYDLYNWKLFKWDIARTRVFLLEDYYDKIKDNIADAIKKYLKSEKDKSKISEIKDFVKNFFSGIETIPISARQDYQFTDLFNPLNIHFWTRLSDIPMESFDAEDYSLTQKSKMSIKDWIFRVPISGAFNLSKISNYELSLPWEEGREGFNLLVHGDAFRICDLSAREFLPITDEYSGKDGASSKGNFINYTSKGKLSSENLGCIPLCKTSPSSFQTLYFQVETCIEHDLTIKLTERAGARTTEFLIKRGFKIVAEKNDNFIMSDHDSIIHFYNNCPGRENLGSRFLPPFIIVVEHEGSVKPEKRAIKVEAIKKLYKG